MWNLPPPPDFQGLRSDLPLTIYQRHLPHWRQDGATYFVTFRLADSLPQSKLDELAALRAAWQRSHPACRPALPSPTALESRPTDDDVALVDLSRELRVRVEEWLDQGMGRSVLKDPTLAAITTSAMHHFDGDRYELDCYVVMPNHVHAILRPFQPEQHPLEEIVGSWKKYSARRINNQLRQQEELWQEESYDSIPRDGEHLWRVVQYIGSNPERAGLPRNCCPMWIRPQWVALGWAFEDTKKTAQESRPTFP